MSLAIAVALGLFTAYINNRQHLVYNQLERVYLDKSVLIFYDGESFHDLSPRFTRPEMAFF